jgi:hypothetical protein
MSSSGLAYALALTWPVERCLMFAFQMVGVPLALHAYLRTHLGSRLVAPHSVCKYVSYFFIWTILNLHHVHGAVAVSCSLCADSWPLPSIPIHTHPFLSVPLICGPCCLGSQAIAAADHWLHLVRCPTEHGGGDLPGAVEAWPRPGGRLHQVPLPSSSIAPAMSSDFMDGERSGCGLIGWFYDVLWDI